LTPETIAGIFLGKITKWNDAALAADNAGVSLPNLDIHVIHRQDGSGTTYIFTDYLSTVSADWKAKTGGPGKSISWPVGDGAMGNAGVATRITQTPGAIGYVELAYVIQTKMTQATLKNHDGNFVIPSAAGATSAAKAFAGTTPSNFSIVDAAGKDSAPISGYSWIIVYKDQPDKTKGTALVDYLYWLVTPDGQQYAVNLHYAALPSDMVSFDIAALKGVTSGGSALLPVSS
jgi:phosphate transport system substrate-binding protein